MLCLEEERKFCFFFGTGVESCEDVWMDGLCCCVCEDVCLFVCVI